jgi:hypothetical protein
LAVAITSAWKPIGQPVGSLRRPTEATEMPTSSPIRCQRLYITECRPDGSVCSMYSSKQFFWYSVDASNTTHTPLRIS